MLDTSFMTLESLQSAWWCCESLQPRNDLSKVSEDDLNFDTDIRLLWSVEHLDGYQSGVALFQGRKVWFQSVTMLRTLTRAFRVFAVVPLTDAEIATEDKRHELFLRYVGNHTTFDPETGQHFRAKDSDQSFYGTIRYWWLSKKAPQYRDETKDLKKPDILGKQVLGYFAN